MNEWPLGKKHPMVRKDRPDARCLLKLRTHYERVGPNQFHLHVCSLTQFSCLVYALLPARLRKKHVRISIFLAWQARKTASVCLISQQKFGSEILPGIPLHPPGFATTINRHGLLMANCGEKLCEITQNQFP
jgi:hypothetical protein